MIIFWENNTLNHRYYSEITRERHGIQTQGPDKEEWVGIRSQIIAHILGWA